MEENKKWKFWGNGIIPLFFKQNYCWLFAGHEYVNVIPEYQGHYGCRCKKCGKFKVF